MSLAVDGEAAERSSCSAVFTRVRREAMMKRICTGALIAEITKDRLAVAAEPEE